MGIMQMSGRIYKALNEPILFVYDAGVYNTYLYLDTKKRRHISM